MLLGTVLIIMGAYFIIAIAIFNFGLKSPRVAKMVETFSKTGTKIFYAVLGLISLGLGLMAVLGII